MPNKPSCKAFKHVKEKSVGLWPRIGIIVPCLVLSLRLSLGAPLEIANLLPNPEDIVIRTNRQANDSTITQEESNSSDPTLDQLAADSGVNIAAILGLQGQNISSSQTLSGFNWNTLFGGKAEPELIDDIYDALENDEFDADLLERIDDTIDDVVEDAVQSGLVSQVSKEDIRYLIKYSYLDLCEALRLCQVLETIDIDRLVQRIPERYYVLALRIFQQIWGLHITGQMNQDTKELMETDRCGNNDEALIGKHTGQEKARNRRYAIAAQWYKHNLTYYVATYPEVSSISDDVVHSDLDRAFNYWAEVCKLHITRVEHQAADMTIMFVVKDHMDGYPFDGVKGTLAHAFLPDDGDCHFDDEENFVPPGSEGTSLFQVAVHELGHSLGLDHSEDYGAVMYPYYKAKAGSEVQLGYDDVSAMQKMYGMPPGPDPVTIPEGEKWTKEKWCQLATFADAAFVNGKGQLFIFVGTAVTMVDGSGIMEGFPKRISEAFPDLPPSGSLDAALHLPPIVTRSCGETVCVSLQAPTRTFFFKGKEYFTYEENSFKERGPIALKFVGLPPDISAAFMMVDGHMYFLKRNWVFRIMREPTTPDDFQVEAGFPQTIDQFFSGPVISVHPSAVVTMYDGTSTYYYYFFVGDKYYRYRHDKKDMDVSSYGEFPRAWSDWFTHCNAFRPIETVDPTGAKLQMLEEVIANATPPAMVVAPTGMKPNLLNWRDSGSTLQSPACFLMFLMVVIVRTVAEFNLRLMPCTVYSA